MIFYVYRNNRNTIQNLREAVDRIFYAPGLVYFDYRNTFADSPDMVANHFLWMHEMSGKSLHVLFHYFSITFTTLKDFSQVQRISEQFLDYLGLSYSVLLAICADPDGCYQSSFLVNAVSRDGRSAFHDRNSTYKDLIRVLADISGHHVDVELADNVLFRNVDNNKVNYTAFEGGIHHDGL